MEMNSQNAFELLEDMIDAQGLVYVMTALETICDEKSMWVNSSESIGTPDKALARTWDKCSCACRKAAEIASDLP
jgi:hypothetical protein